MIFKSVGPLSLDESSLSIGRVTERIKLELTIISNIAGKALGAYNYNFQNGQVCSGESLCTNTPPAFKNRN